MQVKWGHTSHSQNLYVIILRLELENYFSLLGNVILLQMTTLMKWKILKLHVVPLLTLAVPFLKWKTVKN